MTDPEFIPDVTELMATGQNQKYKLKHRYDLTLDQYNQLLYEQGFACKICGITAKDYGKTFAVDHDHTTGKVRGLLCSNCNTGLGLLNDDVETLAKAIIYLSNHQ